MDYRRILSGLGHLKIVALDRLYACESTNYFKTMVGYCRAMVVPRLSGVSWHSTSNESACSCKHMKPSKGCMIVIQLISQYHKIQPLHCEMTVRVSQTRCIYYGKREAADTLCAANLSTGISQD